MKEKRYMREFLRDMGKYYPIDMDQAEKIIRYYKRGMLHEFEVMDALVKLVTAARDAMIEAEKIEVE